MATAKPSTSSKAPKPAGNAAEGLRVVCKQPKGMWRGGRFWPSETTDVSLADLTEDQAEQIRGEPMLVVQEVTIA